MQTRSLASPLPPPTFRSRVLSAPLQSSSHTYFHFFYRRCGHGRFRSERVFQPNEMHVSVSFSNTCNTSHNRSTKAHIYIPRPTSIPLKAKDALQTLCSTQAEGKCPSTCIYTTQQLPLSIAAHFGWSFAIVLCGSLWV